MPLHAGNLTWLVLGSFRERTPRNVQASAIAAGTFQHRAVLAEFTE